LFPEVRIKKVMEVRAADCVSSQMTGALAALMRGLLYSDAALSAASTLLPRSSFEEHLALAEQVRKEGLRAKNAAPLCRELIAIARRGLIEIDPEDAALLEPLEAVMASGCSPAEHVLEAFERAHSPGSFLAEFRLKDGT